MRLLARFRSIAFQNASCFPPALARETGRPPQFACYAAVSRQICSSKVTFCRCLQTVSQLFRLNSLAPSVAPLIRPSKCLLQLPVTFLENPERFKEVLSSVVVPTTDGVGFITLDVGYAYFNSPFRRYEISFTGGSISSINPFRSVAAIL